MIPSTQTTQLLDGVDVLDAGTGPVVALAHGAGGGVRENFTALIDGLADLRFVGPYYPGAGHTPLADDPLAIEDLTDQVVAAAVRAGTDRFPIVGLSLGAAVAVAAAARHPEYVSIPKPRTSSPPPSRVGGWPTSTRSWPGCEHAGHGVGVVVTPSAPVSPGRPG